VLKRSWAWPVKQFISIMDLTGDKIVRISDDGAAKITVNSGIAEYNYIMPAQQK
jgi:Cu2+-containing amine oxidase